jgi:hypothetical protein
VKPGRRRFIQVGVAASALLAAVRWLDAPGRAWAAPAATLSPGEAEIIRALVPVVLSGSLPAESASKRRAVEETVEAFARAVSGLAPAIQEEIGEMLSLLSFAPTRVAMTGISTSWREADPEDIAAFLEDWRASRFELKRAGYRALTQLIQGAWFVNPLAWKAIGYPGPPRITSPLGEGGRGAT